MALKLTGSQAVGRTTALPALSGVTLACYFSYATTPGAVWDAVMGLGNSAGTANTFLNMQQLLPTSTFGIYDGTLRPFTTIPQGGSWYFGAFTHDGSTVRAYMRNIGRNGPMDTISFAHTPAGSTNNMKFGTSAYDGTDFMTGKIQNAKVWTPALSSREILVESYSFEPVTRSKIYGWWPLRTVRDIADKSGNRNNLTVGGTPTTFADNNVAWRATQKFRRRDRAASAQAVVVTAGFSSGFIFG